MLNIIFFLFLTIHFHKAKGAKPEVYEEDADSLFQSILGDVYAIKHIYPITNSTIAAKANKTKILAKYEEEGIFTVTNMTKYDYEMRKLEELLQYNKSSVPDFGEDVIELVTRRFNDIQTRRKRNIAKDVVRRPEEMLSDVNRTISLMEQFVYYTRNRLPYAQLLRKKYKSQLRYKVGFCLALIRNLKQQQLILYNSFNKIKPRGYYGPYNTANTPMSNYIYFLLIYERVLRLDVDIKDVIKLIKNLEKQRRQEEDPKDEIIAEDTIGNSSFPGIPILDFSSANNTQSARRIGWIDPRALDIKNIHGWQRMNSEAQIPVNLNRVNPNIVKPHVNSKKFRYITQNRLPLWAPSYKNKRTDNEVYKILNV